MTAPIDCMLAVNVTAETRWRVRVGISDSIVTVGIKPGERMPTTALVYARSQGHAARFVGSATTKRELSRIMREIVSGSA